MYLYNMSKQPLNEETERILTLMGLNEQSVLDKIKSFIGNLFSGDSDEKKDVDSEVDTESVSKPDDVISPMCGASNPWNVTSPFGPRKLLGYSYHPAVDLAANYEKVVAPFDGTISGSFGNSSNPTNGDCGGMIIIKNDEKKLQAKFCHMSKIDKMSGTVKRGEVVGVSGGAKSDSPSKKGNSQAPHLHFELKKNGQFVDPDKIINKNFCPKK